MDYIPYFSSHFKNNISGRYAGIRKFFENKVKIILKKPFSGEPLKHDLDGLRSERIKGNFILIYSICKECRRKGNDQIFRCKICKETDNNSVVFICIGPHDDSYKIAKKLMKKGKIYS